MYHSVIFEHYYKKKIKFSIAVTAEVVISLSEKSVGSISTINSFLGLLKTNYNTSYNGSDEFSYLFNFHGNFIWMRHLYFKQIIEGERVALSGLVVPCSRLPTNDTGITPLCYETT